MDKHEKIGAVMSKLTPEKISAFRVKQGLPYAVKVNYAKARVREFIQECGRRDRNPYVSVGGLDSITLLMFIRSLGYDVPAVSCSYLEDISIQRIHKQLGVTGLKPSPCGGGGFLESSEGIAGVGLPCAE